MSADTSSGSGGCVSCSDPAPCACSAGESCLQLAATCDTCPRNICTADSSSSSSDAGSGAGNTGAKAGGAVAAVLVIALLCAAAWYFLRTRKRERQRAAFIANARRQSSALKAQAHKGGAQDDARVGKRSSVHLGIVHPGEQHELSRRERHAPRQSVPTEMDNPFADAEGDDDDQDGEDGDGAGRKRGRSALVSIDLDRPSSAAPHDHSSGHGASTSATAAAAQANDARLSAGSLLPFEFGIRGSLSSLAAGSSIGATDGLPGSSSATAAALSRPVSAATTAAPDDALASSSFTGIPIAYIPPHLASVSVSDANGHAGAATLSRSASASRRNNNNDGNVEEDDDMAFEDGSAHIIRRPSPAAESHPSTAGARPIRPPRSPGLDLRLPDDQRQRTPTSGLLSPASAAFPLHRSASTSSRHPPPPPSSLADVPSSRPVSALSTATTVRTSKSTLSYILDAPQIITPVDRAHGPRRVEVVARGQAGELVRLHHHHHHGDVNGNVTGMAPSPIGSSAPVTATTERTEAGPGENPFADQQEQGAAGARVHSAALSSLEFEFDTDLSLDLAFGDSPSSSAAHARETRLSTATTSTSAPRDGALRGPGRPYSSASSARFPSNESSARDSTATTFTRAHDSVARYPSMPSRPPSLAGSTFGGARSPDERATAAGPRVSVRSSSAPTTARLSTQSTDTGAGAGGALEQQQQQQGGRVVSGMSDVSFGGGASATRPGFISGTSSCGGLDGIPFQLGFPQLSMPDLQEPQRRRASGEAHDEQAQRGAQSNVSEKNDNDEEDDEARLSMSSSVFAAAVPRMSGLSDVVSLVSLGGNNNEPGGKENEKPAVEAVDDPFAG